MISANTNQIVNDTSRQRPRGPVQRLLTVTQAGQYLGISGKTIRNQLCRNAKKKFPVKPKKWGKRVLFDKKDLDAFADSLPTLD